MKDIITEIRELRNGLRVTVNDQLMLCLTRKDQRSFTYKEGDAVDAAEWKHQLLLAQYPDALNRAVRLLAVRARSSHEIEKRLNDACYLEDTVEMVLTKLTGNGLLNDLAFAQQWARERTARQLGKARILYELRQKGVDNAIAEEALAQLDAGQQAGSAAALALKLQKRYQNLPAGDAKRKAIQAMQRRGFSYSDAARALAAAAAENGTD